MLQLLSVVRKEVQEVTHLNNQEKNRRLSGKNVRGEDILNCTKELHQSVTIEGNARWPPACNVNNSAAPPKGCGTHLTQCKHNGCQNGELNHHNNGQHKKPFSKKKFARQPKTSWKNKRPKKSQLEKTVDGTPVHSRIADGQKCCTSTEF